MRATAFLIAAAIVAASPRARAEAEPARDEPDRDGPVPLTPPNGLQLSFRLGPRFSQLAPFGHQYQHVLAAYGYNTLAPLLEVSVDAAYSFVRWLDVGVHAGYLFGNAGSSGGSGGPLTLHVLEIGGSAYGVFGRSAGWLIGGYGAGVEGGVELPWLVLRGQSTSARVPYVGPAFFARLSEKSWIQPAVHVKYLVSNWGGAFGQFGLPLGGLSITVGGNLSL
jgi:hypothetical protein